MSGDCYSDLMEILGDNAGFLGEAYAISGLMGLFMLIAAVELILKGFALWRAAKMGKRNWFIAILILNTAGILPLIFILMTKAEYALQQQSSPKTQKKDEIDKNDPIAKQLSEL